MNSSTRFRLAVPPPVLDVLLARAVAALPDECCGLLAGRVAEGVGRVTHHFPLVNVLASPVEYEADPRELLAAARAMRRDGVDVLAVYHSHPTSAPVPSRKDRERNYGERVISLILSPAGPVPEVRAWWLTADDYREAEWGTDT